MKCSFVVSAFNRPLHLGVVLHSLAIQTDGDFEAFITDNAFDDNDASANEVAVAQLRDKRFRYVRTRLANCYQSANYGAEVSSGDYLCFPSDDGYYVPRFLEHMTASGADLIYCDCIYDGHGARYVSMDVAPQCGRIDKGGFLVRRSKFPGFLTVTPGDVNADGIMVERLMRTGATAAKVAGHLWIHN